MNWYAATRTHQRWYPYVMPDGNLLLHWEGADTDMGDVTMEELVEMTGPVVILVTEQ